MISTLLSLAFFLPALSQAAPIIERRSSQDITAQENVPSQELAKRDTPILPRDGTGAVTSAGGLSWYSANTAEGTTGQSDPSSYTCYSGPASNFPAMDTWISFENMWALQVADALTPIGDTAIEQAAILHGIQKISASSLVDPRVILAVIVDESTGNINVGCTNNGVENCGLMQSHDPTDSSFDADHPYRSATQMIRDGTQGTAAGPGLVQYLNDDPDTFTTTDGNLWEMFRAYNSGAINVDDLSDPMGATAAYVSNMANFLTGWNGWGEGSGACDF